LVDELNSKIASLEFKVQNQISELQSEEHRKITQLLTENNFNDILQMFVKRVEEVKEDQKEDKEKDKKEDK